MFRCSLAQKSVEQSKLTKSRQIDRTFTKISTQNILACSILTNFFLIIFFLQLNFEPKDQYFIFFPHIENHKLFEYLAPKVG